MCLIPVNFSSTYSATGEANCSNSFEFAPATFTVLLLQTRDVSYGAADGNDFDVGYLTYNLEVQCLCISFSGLM